MNTAFSRLKLIQRRSLVVSTCILFVIAAALVSGCQRDEVNPSKRTLNLPDQPYKYVEEADLSRIHFSRKQQFEASVTNEGATLGRVLFYDQSLSLNNSVSCGSCHDQQFAFCDPAVKSKGFFAESTRRNSPGWSNLMLYNNYFWDGRSKTLEEQVLLPIQDHIEMGMEDLDKLVAKLKTLSYYRPLFNDAFGDNDITEERIASALAQFLKSMWSFDSKYDRARKSGDFSTFTTAELHGMQLFQHEFICGSCHSEGTMNFGGISQANIGLDLVYEDNGIGELEGMGSTTNGMFKIPVLRNVALTAPYMHDGRFATLEDVLDHYNEKIQRHPNLDFRFIDPNQGWDSGPVNNPGNGGINMGMTEQEKKDIIAFLNTLTDHTYINDPKFSDPFEW